MKATINQLTSETIYKGEDKTFTIYIYNENTFEPIDLSAYDEVVVCLKNEDTTSLEINSSVDMLDIGKTIFNVTAAQSALLAVGSNSLQLKLNDTVAPTTDIEIFSNTIKVKDPAC